VRSTGVILSIIPRIDADFRVRLDASVRESIRPVAVGLAALHVVYALEHYAVMFEPVRAVMVTLATTTATALVLLAILLGRWQPSHHWGHPLAGVRPEAAA